MGFYHFCHNKDNNCLQDFVILLHNILDYKLRAGNTSFKMCKETKFEPEASILDPQVIYPFVHETLVTKLRTLKYVNLRANSTKI